jgi:hypothetical protein
MKKLLSLISVCLLIAGSSMAQAQPKDEWTLFKEAFHKEKKELVNEYMKLSTDQASKFWPLYEEYNQAKGAIGKERLGVIDDYATHLSTLTDEQANDLASRLFKNDKALTSLDQKYFKKLSKAIGGVKAAQYLQMEQYFTTTIRSAIQEEIPFIGEIDRASGH